MVKKLKQRIQADQNFLYSLFIQGTNTILPLIVYLIYNNKVDSHNAGNVYYYKALLIPVATLVDFGLNIYSSRELAKTENNLVRSKIISETILLKLIIFSVLFLSILIYGLIFQSSILLFLSGFFLLEKLFDLFWYFQGNQEFQKLFFYVFFSKIVLLTFVIIFINNQNYFLLPLLEGMAYAIVGSFFAYHIIKRQKGITFDLNNIIQRAKGTWKLCLSSFMNILSAKSFLLLTGLIVNPSQYLIFDVAEKVLNLAKSIISAYEIMIAPKLYASINKNTFLLTLKKFILLVIIIFLTFQSINFINSDVLELENIFYNSSRVIRILLWSLFPITISMLFGTLFLLAKGKDGKVIFNQIIQISLTLITFGLFLILQSKPNIIEFSLLFVFNQIMITIIIILTNYKIFKNFFN
mgnify:CR=1 FL=1